MSKERITAVLIIIIAALSACELEPEWNFVAESSFQNGWVNLADSTPLSYYMEKNGAVYLRGDVQDTVTAQNSSSIVVLPEKYRPSVQHVFPVVMQVYDTYVHMATGILYINTDGSVRVSSNTVAEVQRVYINNISYFVD